MYLVTNPPPHIYAGAGFDRAAERRKDPAALAAMRADPRARLLAMVGLRVLMTGSEEAPELLRLEAAALADGLPAEAIFLGLEHERPLFAIQVAEDAFAEAGRFVEIRSVGPALPRIDAGLLAYARALAHWHGGHRHCGSCGRRTTVIQGGHARACEHCGIEIFPRMDPAVIVLVTLGDRCLLGRASRFPEGMYSTLAGFVEVGESLEDTVRREIFEEVGIELGEIRYRSSQPWPFPQSLMLGFRAEAVTERIQIDPDELTDARWLERRHLRDPATRPVRLPGADSIARFLIDEWLAEDDEA